MGADGHAMLQSEFDAPAHRNGITGVTAAGDVGGTDKGKYLGIGGYAFAHVAVQVDGGAVLKIDPQHTTSLR